jgi:protein-L-isoaspartate(D-aspartate) O-methyltransferase
MIIPVGELYSQELVLLEKQGNEVRRRAVLPVRFVPMTGQAEKRQD